MDRMVVTDPVPGCLLESVELEYESIDATITASDGTTKAITLRVFVPVTVDGGKSPIGNYAERLVRARRQSRGEERAFIEWIMMMMMARAYLTGHDEKHVRQFDISTLDPHLSERKKTPFDETRDTLRVEGLPNLELMAAMSRGVEDDMGQLMQRALYQKPEFELTLSEDRYFEFRDQVFEELVSTRGLIEDISDDFIDSEVRHVRKDPKLSRAEKQAGIESIRSTRAALIEKGMADQLITTFKREAAFAEHFVDLLACARRIHDRMSPLFDAEGMLEPDGSIGCGESQLREFLQQHLEIASVNEMITELLIRLRSRYALTTQELKLSVRKVGKLYSGDFEKRFALEAYGILEKQLLSTDAVEKWQALLFVLISFADRNDCVRHFERECEQVLIEVIDSVHREIFKKIRRTLTPPERRLFLLMYCALPKLERRIAILDPPLSSFYWGMDEETQALVWLSLVYKINDFGGETRLDLELERRFRVYLKFYPFWVMLMRQHQSSQKSQKGYESTTTSLSSSTGQEEDSDLESILADPLTTNKNPLTALALATHTCRREWIDRYCRPNDIPRMLKYYEDDFTEVEIADQEGVSQQAVSQTLIRGYRDLVDGLKRDGII